MAVDEYLDMFDDESDLEASDHMLSEYSDGEELIEESDGEELVDRQTEIYSVADG